LGKQAIPQRDTLDCGEFLRSEQIEIDLYQGANKELSGADCRLKQKAIGRGCGVLPL